MAQNSTNFKIESYIKDMPSLPVSIRKVMEICDATSVNPSDLNRVISLDPVLTGKLLQLINSAYYGLGYHVTSLVKAITRLGINTVKNLALSTAILGTLPKNKDHYGLNMEGFWRHCLSVGVAAKLLAVRQGVDPKYHQEYFTAGLLHDIGKIPLSAALDSEYMNTVSIADREHKPLVNVEDESLGINHCAAGGMIAKEWKLYYSPVADVIIWHHDISGYYGDNMHILCSVAIANYFSVAYDIGFSGNRKSVKPEKKIWETAGLKEDSLDDLKEKVFQEIEKAKIFLKI
jgi:HD-like signal output (HDOD) protein